MPEVLSYHFENVEIRKTSARHTFRFKKREIILFPLLVIISVLLIMRILCDKHSVLCVTSQYPELTAKNVKSGSKLGMSNPYSSNISL